MSEQADRQEWQPDPNDGPAPDDRLALQDRQAVNEELQHMLVRVSTIGETLGHLAAAPGQALLGQVKERLKATLAASQQQLRADRAAATPAFTPAACPAGSGPSPHEINWTLDLSAPGHLVGIHLGPEVAQLQLLLQRLGMPVKVSGRFDRATEQAVRMLQVSHKLARRDGVVDADTRRLVQRLIGERA